MIVAAKRRHYSATEVVQVCGVSLPVVYNWITSGKLASFKYGNSTHRRVTWQSLIRFMLSCGMHDFAKQEGWQPSNLLISDSPDLRAKLANEHGWHVCSNLVQALQLVDVHLPDTIYVDWSSSSRQAIARALTRNYPAGKLVLVHYGDVPEKGNSFTASVHANEIV